MGEGAGELKTLSTQVPKAIVDAQAFNQRRTLPYSLRVADFRMAMQDVYDFLYDVNDHLVGKNLPRLEQTFRPAILSGMLSDLLTGSLASHSRSLTVNRQFNGHPDLVVAGRYAGDAVEAGQYGVEIKCTKKRGGAVDTHGARRQWLCVFVYDVDQQTQPVIARRPVEFIEVYLASVRVSDFRRNARGELGTRTATLHKEGLRKLRAGWVYRR